MKKFYIFFFIFFLHIDSIAHAIRNINTEILCVDIGGTRIKAAVLHPEISLEELQSIFVATFDSKEYLNEHISDLFNPFLDHSLPQRLSIPYHQISFGITGPILEGSLYITEKMKIPLHLKKACEKASGCAVFVENDGIIWARGVHYWQSLIKEDLSFPCLCVTLGTAVGMSILYSPEEAINVEYAFLNIPFQRIKQLTKTQTGHPLGRDFFHWIEKEHIEDEKIIQKIYTTRIIAFLKDLEDFFAKKHMQFNTIAIGGGNSRYALPMYIQAEFDQKINVLNPSYFMKFKVSPDIISLLGCLITPYVPLAKMIPSWQEILEKKKHF